MHTWIQKEKASEPLRWLAPYPSSWSQVAVHALVSQDQQHACPAIDDARKQKGSCQDHQYKPELGLATQSSHGCLSKATANKRQSCSDWSQGVHNKLLPAQRCATARRANVTQPRIGWPEKLNCQALHYSNTRSSSMHHAHAAQYAKGVCLRRCKIVQQQHRASHRNHES